MSTAPSPLTEIAALTRNLADANQQLEWQTQQLNELTQTDRGFGGYISQINTERENLRAQVVALEADKLRLDRLIKSMVPTFIQNSMGWICLDETMEGEPIPEQPMANFKHWPTARDAIDHIGERTEAGVAWSAAQPQREITTTNKIL